MRTVLIAPSANAEVWGKLLSADLPDHDVRVAPPEDGRDIPYLVVGQPLPGLMSSVKGLEVVLSMNAGVEGLLARGEVAASVPIVRMVDPSLTDGMVEWVMAHALAWHRNLFKYREDQRQARWAPRHELLARERTVTVLGAGALGAPVSQMLRALGFNTRVWSRTLHLLEGRKVFAGDEQLSDALRGADILINLLPLTRQTEDLIGATAFAALAPGAFFINGGRGGTIVDADLVAALDNGILSGAALDVFREEPLAPDHEFWRHPAILVSPHVAAPTHARSAASVMAETIRRHERGEPLSHLVDRTRGY